MLRKFLVYFIRWQSGFFVMMPSMFYFHEYLHLKLWLSLIISQAIGACIYFFIDKAIFSLETTNKKTPKTTEPTAFEKYFEYTSEKIEENKYSYPIAFYDQAMQFQTIDAIEGIPITKEMFDSFNSWKVKHGVGVMKEKKNIVVEWWEQYKKGDAEDEEGKAGIVEFKTGG